MSAWTPLTTGKPNQPRPAHAEDSQPNEQIDKRARQNPPLVRITAPTSRGHPFRGRGSDPPHGGSRRAGRGGWTSAQTFRPWGPPPEDAGSSRPRPRDTDAPIAFYPPSIMDGTVSRGPRHSQPLMDEGKFAQAVPSTTPPVHLPAELRASTSATWTSSERLFSLAQAQARHPSLPKPVMTTPIGDAVSEPTSSVSVVGIPQSVRPPSNSHAHGPPSVHWPKVERSSDLRAPPSTQNNAAPPPIPTPPPIQPMSIPVVRSAEPSHGRALALSALTIAPSSSLNSNEPLSMRVKRERSATPELSARFQQMSGAKLFAPLPANCSKAVPNYHKHRKAWAAREARRMERDSFVKTGRMLIREDGLVIEWTSARPVWSDSLLPVAAKHLRASAQAHLGDQSSKANSSCRSHPPGKRKRPTPDGGTLCMESTEVDDGQIGQSLMSTPEAFQDNEPSRHATGALRAPPVSVAEGLGTTRTELNDDTFGSGLQPLLPKPAYFPTTMRKIQTSSNDPSGSERPANPSDSSTPGSPSNTAPSSDTPRPSYAAARDAGTSPIVKLSTGEKVHTAEEKLSYEEIEGIHGAALEFITRYLRAFDMERAELANAYTSDATFSCSGSVKSAPAAGSLRAFLPEENGACPLKQGRLDILSCLLLLKSTYRLPLPKADVKHDFGVFGKAQGVMVVVDGTLCDLTQKPEHRISFRHAFVLKRKEWLEGSDRSNGDLWPLVAVSHQLMVRDIVLRKHLV